MDYHQSKLRDCIREAIQEALEYTELMKVRIRMTGNTYSSIQHAEEYAQHIKEIVEKTAKEIEAKGLACTTSNY